MRSPSHRAIQQVRRREWGHLLLAHAIDRITCAVVANEAHWQNGDDDGGSGGGVDSHTSEQVGQRPPANEKRHPIAI